VAGSAEIERIIREDGRYPMAAFEFLHEGLQRAVAGRHGEGEEPKEPQHVTGEEICLALRDLALQRWGPLAPTVLARWQIRETIDFGNMVYLLIDRGFWRKTPEDSVEDFRDVYSFESAFRAAGAFRLNQ